MPSASPTVVEWDRVLAWLADDLRDTVARLTACQGWELLTWVVLVKLPGLGLEQAMRVGYEMLEGRGAGVDLSAALEGA